MVFPTGIASLASVGYAIQGTSYRIRFAYIRYLAFDSVAFFLSNGVPDWNRTSIEAFGGLYSIH